MVVGRLVFDFARHSVEKTIRVKQFDSETRNLLVVLLNDGEPYEMPEEKYDELLEEALVKFKKMLEDNSSLYDYVYNTVTVSDEDTEDDILRKITEGA